MPSNPENLRRAEKRLRRAYFHVMCAAAALKLAQHDVSFAKVVLAAARRRLRWRKRR